MLALWADSRDDVRVNWLDQTVQAAEAEAEVVGGAVAKEAEARDSITSDQIHLLAQPRSKWSRTLRDWN